MSDDDGTDSSIRVPVVRCAFQAYQLPLLGNELLLHLPNGRRRHRT
jgi:hypothetical protein